MTGSPRALVVLGAGGHGREIIAAVVAVNTVRDQWRLIGVLDDDESVVPALRALGVQWLGPLSSLPWLDAEYVIGIGNSQTRRQIDDAATMAGMRAATIVHPSSSVGVANQLADGVYLAAQSTVTTNVVLGRHAHVNVGASVAHDSTIGAYVNLSPGARLGGHAALGSEVFMGINSSVLPHCRVGERAVIGAGATVVSDIDAGTTCIGTPARPLAAGYRRTTARPSAASAGPPKSVRELDGKTFRRSGGGNTPMSVYVGLYDDHNAGFAAVDENGIVGYTEFERLTRIKNQDGWLPDLVGRCFDALPLDRLAAVTAPRPELVKELLCRRYGAVPGETGTVVLEGKLIRLLPQPDLHAYFHLLAATTVPLAGPGIYLVIVFDAEQPRFGWIDLRGPLAGPGVKALTPITDERWFNGAVFGDLFGRLFYGSGDLSNCGKLMGLSSWGTTRLKHTEYLERLAQDTFDPAVETWNGYCGGSADHVSIVAEEYLGVSPRDHEASSTLDLAASAQAVFTHRFIEQVRSGCRRTREQIRDAGITDEPIGVLYGGGCALSVVSNSEVREVVGLPVFIPPFAHDASQFVGGAVWAGLVDGMHWTAGRGWPGIPEHTADQVSSASAANAGYAMAPAPPFAVAEIIASGGLVALARGGSEAGPRALGHRSLLARAADPGMRDRLNDQVKKREWYRPYAPMLPTQEFSRYFDATASPASAYMLDSYRTRPKFRRRLSSVTGPDGIARAQSVDAATDPFLYQVCCELGRLTGDPVLLNTSLNAPGRTIAHDLTQVVDDSIELGVDAVVIDETFLDVRGNLR